MVLESSGSDVFSTAPALKDPLPLLSSWNLTQFPFSSQFSLLVTSRDGGLLPELPIRRTILGTGVMAQTVKLLLATPAAHI